jgi:ActR/RegA family two-component response regulator
MKPLSVVLLQTDAPTSRALAASLCHHFHAVFCVNSIKELREAVLKHRPEVAVVDMEIAGLAEVQNMSREFGGMCIVCTHRLADDEMWTAALTAGATDVCRSRDTRAIVTSMLRYSQGRARSVAA